MRFVAGAFLVAGMLLLALATPTSAAGSNIVSTTYGKVEGYTAKVRVFLETAHSASTCPVLAGMGGRVVEAARH